MKKSEKSFVFILSAFFCYLFAVPEEVALQNGLNEYNGCIDSYSSNQDKATNFGNAKTLEVRCDGCGGDLPVAWTAIKFEMPSL